MKAIVWTLALAAAGSGAQAVQPDKGQHISTHGETHVWRNFAIGNGQCAKLRPARVSRPEHVNEPQQLPGWPGHAPCTVQSRLMMENGDTVLFCRTVGELRRAVLAQHPSDEPACAPRYTVRVGG